MATGDSKGGRAHHHIDTRFGARELRQLGDRELGYLKEVLAGDDGPGIHSLEDEYLQFYL